ncbi:unnamed protein product [Jaminaea pallidilutea]
MGAFESRLRASESRQPASQPATEEREAECDFRSDEPECRPDPIQSHQATQYLTQWPTAFQSVDFNSQKAQDKTNRQAR